MKRTLVLLMFLPVFLFGQIPSGLVNPDNRAEGPSEISYPQLHANFERLMNTKDPKAKRAKLKAQRWWEYSFLNYNIEDNGKSFGMNDFLKAQRAIHTSPLNCGKDDPANWESDGPYNLPPNSFGQGGGWVDAIYNHPENTDIVLVGTRTSGIMRTTDGGVTWNSVTDNVSFPVLGVRQIVADPNNPDYLLALTGNPDAPNQGGGSTDIEGGLIYSNDGGASWNEHVGAPNFHWMGYHPIAVGVLFATAQKSLYYSNNYGATWINLGTPPDFDSSTEYLFKIMVTNYTIFFNTKTKFSPISKLYKADIAIVGDFDVVVTSWNDITDAFIAPDETLTFSGFSNRLGDRFLLEVQGRYVTDIVDGEPEYDYNNYLLETTDGGGSFSPTAVSFSGYLENPGFHKNELILSPNDASVMYWGTIKRMRKYNLLTGSYVTIFGVPGNDGHHDDYRSSHILDSDGEDRIVVGNDGGAALIKNGLDASPKIQSLNGNLSINLLHAFDVHEATGRIAYAFQDHKMYYRDTDGTYSYPFIHEGSFAMIQRDNPDAIVGENAYSGIRDILGSPHPIVDEGAISGGGFYLGGYQVHYRHHPERFARGLSTKGNIVMNFEANDTQIVNIPLASYGIGPVAICERDVKVLYAADLTRLNNPNRFFKSVNDGSSWTDKSNALVSLDEGTTIAPLHELLRWNHIRAIAVDHVDSKLVYLGIGGTHKVSGAITDERFRVLRSTNGGDSFEDFSEGLPALPVERLLTIESDNDLIFCATSVGIYYRTKDMSAWRCFSKNLPKARITGLKYDYCSNTLFASTYGRGLWKTKVDVTIETDYALEINTDVVWDTPRDVYEDVLIKSGNTLTITSLVKMAKDRKIMVETGAKLEVNGGTITALQNCQSDNLWTGIEVWGTSDASQTYADQGWVILKNATISDAHLAVTLWKPDHWAQTGGVIQAYNSTFRNNRRAVAFMNYTDETDTGIEKPNKSLFRNVHFIWDNDFLHRPLNHVSLYKVTGVRFGGCHFSDNRTDANFTSPYLENDGAITKCGIRSIDAKYYVNDISDGPSTFNNLDFGIYASNATSIYPISVEDAVFTNNLYGIEVVGLFAPKIIFNTFQFSFDGNYYLEHNKYGIHLVRTQDISVEENEFINLTSFEDMGVCIGIVCSDLGENNEMIRKNTFKGLTYGNLAQGNNRGAMMPFPDGSLGLSYECNENRYNSNDFRILNTLWGTFDATYGVKTDMGHYSQAAGNTFTEDFATNFNNGTAHLLRYFYKEGIADQNPMTVINVEKVPTPFEAKCKTNYPYHNQAVGTLEAEFYQLHSQWLQGLPQYEAQVAQNNVNPQLEHQLIYLNHQKSQLATLIRNTLYHQDGFNSGAIKNWIANGEAVLYRMQLIDLHIQQAQYSDAYNHLNALISEAANYPQELQVEIGHFIKLKEVIIPVLSQGQALSQLSSNAKNQVDYIANKGVGLAKYQAQELLCFFYETCKAKNIPITGTNAASSNSMAMPTVALDGMLILAPNPTSGILNMKAKLPITNIRVMDLNGRLLIERKLETSSLKHQLNLESLHTGFYLVEVHMGTHKEVKKILKE